MRAKRIVLSFVALALLVLAISQYTLAQGQDEDPEAASMVDDGTPPLPDEVIGDAVADPARLLDQHVEPNPVGFDEVTAPEAAVEPAEADEVVSGAAVLDDGVPVQGRVATADGVPLHGSYDISMALYTVDAGGTAVCVDTDTVDVVNGLFSAVLNGCTTNDISGQQLYLGIKVGGDPEMTPRQPVYATPYAHSLRPGAVIAKTDPGHALTVTSDEPLMVDSALLAHNTNTTSGVAIRAIAEGNEAPIISLNPSTGPLFRAFGSGGGEDEFRINNDGSLESKADSYLWIPGNGLIKNENDDSTRWDIQPNGAARIWRGTVAGSKIVYYPVVLPSVLYGQPVEIKRLTVYYVCENGTNNFVTGTYLRRQTDADSYESLINHGSDHKSNTATSYTLELDDDDGLLSASQGALGLYLSLQFANNTEYVQIGGIRLELGHHELY